MFDRIKAFFEFVSSPLAGQVVKSYVSIVPIVVQLFQTPDSPE